MGGCSWDGSRDAAVEREEQEYLDGEDLLDVEVQVAQVGECFDGKSDFDAVVAQTLTQTSCNQNKPTVG